MLINSYSEAIDLLYRKVTFDFRRAEALIRMQRIMLPQRLQCIQSVRLSVTFTLPEGERYSARGWDEPTFHYLNVWPKDDDRMKWQLACRALSSLKSLRELRLCITVHERGDMQDLKAFNDDLFSLLEQSNQIHASNFVLVLTRTIPDEVMARLGSVAFMLQYQQPPSREVGRVRTRIRRRRVHVQRIW